LASSPYWDRSWNASSNDSGRWYSNLEGSIKDLLDRSRASSGVAARTGTATITPARANGQVNPVAPLGIVAVVAGSNRGFWKVLIPLGVAGIVLFVLVIVFRPVARAGAVAYAQANLRKAAEAAETVAAADGSLADATRQRLKDEGSIDDLLLIDPDESSNHPEVVSVLATEATWTGSVRAETGECFWIRLRAGSGSGVRTVLGTGTDCSAEAASAAEPGAWSEP